jgi:hypothetical protein
MISTLLFLALTSWSRSTERTPVWRQPFRPTRGANRRSGPKGSPQKRHIITLQAREIKNICTRVKKEIILTKIRPFVKSKIILEICEFLNDVKPHPLHKDKFKRKTG